MVEAGDRKIAPVTASIESRLVYPAVNGPEIVRFGMSSQFYVLVTQDRLTRKPHPAEWMQQHAPLTYAYLRPFEKPLLNRGSKQIKELAEDTDFYAMFGIGDYSFAPYRVTWHRSTHSMAAVVLSMLRTPFGKREVIACDHAAFYPVAGLAEAHYLCGLMNSSHVDDFLGSASPSAEIAPPGAVKPLAIPKFSPRDPLHNTLSTLSLKAHKLVKGRKPTKEIDCEINRAVAKLWSIES